MTCEDVEHAVLEGARPSEVEAHLEGCAACRAFAAEVEAVSTAASLEPLTAADRAALAQVADGVWKASRPAPVTRTPWLGYAVAASVGALLAGAGVWATRPVKEVVIERAGPVVEVAQVNDDLNLSSDEVFFDVTWPDLSDGENP